MTYNKKQIWLWGLYDLANSMGLIAVIFYFSLWFVEDVKGADIWVSLPVSLSTILLLLTTPYLGVLSDRLKKRMPFIRFFTVATIISLFVLGLIAVQTTSTSGPWFIVGVVIFYFLFQYFYQASSAFYNAFLHNLADGESKEKVSGLGIALGQIGNVVGLVLLMLVASGTVSLFGFSGRSATFMAAAILFALAVLPVLLFLKDNSRSVEMVENKKGGLRGSLKATYQSLLKIKQYPNVFRYLISYYLFSDAVLTFQIFLTLYLGQVGGLNDTWKNIVLISGIAFAVLGAFLSHWIARKMGGTRKTISIFILILAITSVIFVFANSPIFFVIAAILMVGAYGVLVPLSRAYYVHLTPKDNQGEFFSIYGLFEKFASVLGPLLWSAAILIFTSVSDIDKYRAGAFSLALMLVASFLVFRTIKDDELIKT